MHKKCRAQYSYFGLLFTVPQAIEVNDLKPAILKYAMQNCSNKLMIKHNLFIFKCLRYQAAP